MVLGEGQDVEAQPREIRELFFRQTLCVLCCEGQRLSFSFAPRCRAASHAQRLRFGTVQNRLILQHQPGEDFWSPPLNGVPGGLFADAAPAESRSVSIIKAHALENSLCNNNNNNKIT